MHVRSRILLFALSLLCSALLLAQEKPLQQSKNGWYLSPHGTIRILVIFVEIHYDVKPEKDPQPEGHPTWAKGELPSWADNLFDPHELPQQKAMVSRYFEDISFGQYTVLGDYLDEVITLRKANSPVSIKLTPSGGSRYRKRTNAPLSKRTTAWPSPTSTSGRTVANKDCRKNKGPMSHIPSTMSW